MKANFPALVLALLLAGCASAPKPLPAPAPVPVPVAVPPKRPTPPTQLPTLSQPADWRDALRTPGNWTWSRDGTWSVADYSDWFRLSCNPATRKVTIVVRFRDGPHEPGPMVVTTTSSRIVLSAEPAGDSLQASLSANDPLLDAMAFSRGRFMVEVSGRSPLYLPSWAEVSRVIEDCR